MSFDTVEANHAFAEKFDFPFVLLCDTARDLGVKYGAAADRNATHAKRVSCLIGPDGTIAKLYDSVDPLEHADQILNDISGL